MAESAGDGAQGRPHSLTARAKDSLIMFRGLTPPCNSGSERTTRRAAKPNVRAWLPIIKSAVHH